MLRRRGVIDQLKSYRIAGRRHDGHFSQDDSYHIGPQVNSGVQQRSSLPPQSSEVEATYEPFIDPKTGERLYRQKR